MISFISSAPFKEKPCYKFMLKYDITSYLRQFTKLSAFVSSEIQHTQDLVMRNYFWLEQLNVRIKCGALSDKYIRFVQYIKLFKIKVLNLYHLKKMVF